MNELKILAKPNYTLLAIMAALVAIHFTVLFKSATNSNIASLHCLLFVGIASLIWEERQNIEVHSKPLETLIGIILIGWILLRTVSPVGYQINVAPLVWGLGICLLVNGYSALRKYRKELILLSLTALYPLVASLLTMAGITESTAKTSSFLLWATGFHVHREGVIINLPKGKVEVLGACAGIDAMLLMLTVNIMFFILIPLKLKDKVVSLIVAGLISFLLNSIRIAILALMADAGDMNSFEYWHGGEGSLVFSFISVAIFGTFCWLFYVRKIIQEKSSEDAEDIN